MYSPFPRRTAVATRSATKAARCEMSHVSLPFTVACRFVSITSLSDIPSPLARRPARLGDVPSQRLGIPESSDRAHDEPERVAIEHLDLARRVAQ